ncbi:MAG TPA: exodeoxyribonuclease VII small subunit [Gemmatimonadaceae bacterium]
MTFEEDLARIETIVAELERDDLQLDSALALFEEGVQRLRSAAEALARAEGEVKRLVEHDDGSFGLSDLDV